LDQVALVPKNFSLPDPFYGRPGEVIAGLPIEPESDHFFQCPRCGTWIDCRWLGELLSHEDWCTCLGNTTPMPGHDAPPHKH
jgi:hypothetical protein